MKKLNLESGTGSCFSHQIGKCLGACINKESQMNHAMRLSMAIHKLLIPEWPFRGEVLLIEQNKNNGILEKHTVKDWTYIKYEIEGKKSDDKYHLVPPSHFDHDIFFILRKLIAKPPVDMSIIPNQ